MFHAVNAKTAKISFNFLKFQVSTQNQDNNRLLAYITQGVTESSQYWLLNILEGDISHNQVKSWYKT